MPRLTKAEIAELQIYAELLNIEPNDIHEGVRDYIQETTGYDADLKSVQLALVLRAPYSQSEQNETRKAARQEASEAKRTEIADRVQARIDEKAAKLEAELELLRSGNAPRRGRPPGSANKAKPAVKLPPPVKAIKAAPAKATTKAAPHKTVAAAGEPKRGRGRPRKLTAVPDADVTTPAPAAERGAIREPSNIEDDY